MGGVSLACCSIRSRDDIVSSEEHEGAGAVEVQSSRERHREDLSAKALVSWSGCYGRSTSLAVVAAVCLCTRWSATALAVALASLALLWRTATASAASGRAAATCRPRPVASRREGSCTVVPKSVGLVTPEDYERGASSESTWQLPLECAPLTRDEEQCYQAVQRKTAGKTWATLRYEGCKNDLLRVLDTTSAEAQSLVDFDPREIVRVILSARSTGETPGDAMDEACAVELEKIYAMRFHHSMSSLRFEPDYSDADMERCRCIYPKVVYGLAKSHGYPIAWDFVSALRIKKMEANFGSLDRALTKILWYDLHFMELYNRYYSSLSSSRGLFVIKGVHVIDLGSWSADLVHPKILKTCIHIISRSSWLIPESLWRLYLINVPYVFMGVWAMIKPGVHPVTLAKVRMFASRESFLAELEGELGVPREMVPREHGGTGPSVLDLPMVPQPAQQPLRTIPLARMRS